MTDKQFLIVAGVGALAVWYLANRAAAVVNKLNPVNPDNIFHSTANDLGKALSDDPNFSLGSWVYDFFHEEYDPNKPATK